MKCDEEVMRKLEATLLGRRQSENLTSGSTVSGTQGGQSENLMSESTTCWELQRNYRPYQLRPCEMEKRQRRSLRNRLSATRSRLKREEKLQNLEKTVQQKEIENKCIERTILELKEELNELQSSLNKHKPHCKLQYALPSSKQEIDNNHHGSSMNATDHNSNFSQSFSTVETEQMDIVHNDVISLKSMNYSFDELSLANMDEEDQSTLEAIINTLYPNKASETRPYPSMSSACGDYQHYTFCQYGSAGATSIDNVGTDGPTPQLNYPEPGSQPFLNVFSTNTETPLPIFKEPVSGTTWSQQVNTINNETTCHMSGTESTAEALPFHKRETKMLGSQRTPDNVCLRDSSTETSTNVRWQNVLTRMLDCDIYKNTIPTVQTARCSGQIYTTDTCSMLPRYNKGNILCVTQTPVNDQPISVCDKKVLSTSSHRSIPEPVSTIPCPKQTRESEAKVTHTPITDLILSLQHEQAVEAIESYLRDETKTNPETYYLQYLTEMRTCISARADN